LFKEEDEMKPYRGNHNKKTTEEMKTNFKQMRDSGATYEKIAKHHDVSITCVYYHLNEKRRKQALENEKRARREGRAWSQRNPEKYKKWNTEYQADRYKNDPEFRQRMITHVKNYETRKKESLIVGDNSDGY